MKFIYFAIALLCAVNITTQTTMSSKKTTSNSAKKNAQAEKKSKKALKKAKEIDLAKRTYDPLRPLSAHSVNAGVDLENKQHNALNNISTRSDNQMTLNPHLAHINNPEHQYF